MIFSAIVPFLNEERYLEECIKALLGQDFDKNKYELIFVDNGSEDRSKDIVRKYPRIILLEEPRKSSYAARNKGLGMAKGQIIAFTDADCAVSPDWLTCIYEGVTKNEATIALGKRSFPQKCSALLHFYEDYDNAKTEYVLNNCPKEYLYGFTNNMAARSDVFKRIGKFTELARGGDTEFVHRCMSNIPGAKIVYLSTMKITHLEIKNTNAWLKKHISYGEHNARLEKISGYKKLNYRTKIRICLYCARRNKYTFLQNVFFLFTLALGDLCYNIGILKGRIKSPYNAKDLF